MEHIASTSPFLIVLLGDFNARMQGWYQNDITTFEGCKIDIGTSQFGLSQIIKEPTHILSNSASCIDLIITSQPNLVMHSGVHPSLHPNCHHQLIFAKLNLFFFILHLTSDEYCTINKQIQILLNERLNHLIGKKLFLILT